eukprot:4176217-Amphidinium_carterae.1
MERRVRLRGQRLKFLKMLHQPTLEDGGQASDDPIEARAMQGIAVDVKGAELATCSASRADNNKEDEWEWRGMYLIRHHRKARRKIYVPSWSDPELNGLRPDTVRCPSLMSRTRQGRHTLALSRITTSTMPHQKIKVAGGLAVLFSGSWKYNSQTH